MRLRRLSLFIISFLIIFTIGGVVDAVSVNRSITCTNSMFTTNITVSLNPSNDFNFGAIGYQVSERVLNTVGIISFPTSYNYDGTTYVKNLIVDNYNLTFLYIGNNLSNASFSYSFLVPINSGGYNFVGVYRYPPGTGEGVNSGNVGGDGGVVLSNGSCTNVIPTPTPTPVPTSVSQPSQAGYPLAPELYPDIIREVTEGQKIAEKAISQEAWLSVFLVVLVISFLASLNSINKNNRKPNFKGYRSIGRKWKRR